MIYALIFFQGFTAPERRGKAEAHPGTVPLSVKASPRFFPAGLIGSGVPHFFFFSLHAAA
jgi:hypothetical protein